MRIAAVSSLFGAAMVLQGCSFTLPVPEQYQTDNTAGCAVDVEDARTQTRALSFGRSELVSDPALAQVVLREACSRDVLRARPVTIRITSAFCDTSEWALNAYAEMHARAWEHNGEHPMTAMRTANGTAEGPAPAICGNLFWPLAAELVDIIEANFTEQVSGVKVAAGDGSS